ncbi:MAG: putative anti-sigma regulatory factor, serine/threonine protein kinase [Solirubrobacterales bacterium]|jgi:anti-sigma regulatory factor (Ser/Thr protein kinase)|nr:putative anti-sigma regulatory factor, serine/threonine protein kinase [Solirubrobacterales bacterium]
MAAPPNIRLDLSNRPENVVLVRETLAGVAEAIGLDAADLDDIRTAVTEACNNVVLHAYEGEEGALEVEIYATGGSCGVFVRDRGIGLQPQTSEDQWIVGIGLPVIEALSQRVDFEETTGGGTEVRMEFATPGARTLEAPDDESSGFPNGARGAGSTTSVTIAPVAPLARTVLPRLLGVLAARAQFSTDRISDALLVADALSAHASRSANAGHLRITVSIEPRNLQLSLGPLDSGGARALVSGSNVDGVGRVIEKLSDHLGVVVDGAYEVLDLQIIDRR